MPEKDAQTDAIRLQAGRDDDRQIIIHPADNDLFVATGKQVIEACRLHISVDVWFQELSAMLQEVRSWAQKRGSQVRSCFCVPRGTRVILFFVPATPQFDFDLADALAILNGELVKGFNVGMIEVRQIPWDELDRFLNTDKAKLVYGEQPESHQPVEA